MEIQGGTNMLDFGGILSQAAHNVIVRTVGGYSTLFSLTFHAFPRHGITLLTCFPHTRQALLLVKMNPCGSSRNLGKCSVISRLKHQFLCQSPNSSTRVARTHPSSSLQTRNPSSSRAKQRANPLNSVVARAAHVRHAKFWQTCSRRYTHRARKPPRIHR